MEISNDENTGGERTLAISRSVSLLARVALEEIGQELESTGLKSVLATMYPLAPNSPFASSLKMDLKPCQ